MHNRQGCVSNNRAHRKWFETFKEAQNLLKSLSFKNTKLKWLKLVNSREFHIEVYLTSEIN